MIGLALRFGPWALIGLAALVAWGLWGRLEVANLKLANAQAVIAQREKDQKDNAVAIAKLADALAKTEAKIVTVTQRIYAAPVTRECVGSPAVRVARDGVRELVGGPGPAERRP